MRTLITFAFFVFLSLIRPNQSATTGRPLTTTTVIIPDGVEHAQPDAPDAAADTVSIVTGTDTATPKVGDSDSPGDTAANKLPPPAHVNLQNEVQRHFEFEDALSDTQQSYWVWRSEASNLKVLRLEDQSRRHRIEFRLCIEPYVYGDNSTLVLDDIRYANDGPSDVVFVTFNGSPFASFLTHEKWRSGHEWNVFRNSGQLGSPMVLDKGTYTIQVSAMTDSYGVEFDRIRVNVENQDPTKDIFCGASLSVV